MIKKIEGIIVTEVDYKESSKIINILTKENGILGVLAKGAKKMKSPLANVTSKITYGNFYLNWHDNGMPSLIEVDIINKFKKIKTDLTKTSYALFLLELSTQVYRHENNNNIYNLLIDSLIKIEENFDPLVITNILELKLSEYLGIKPIIDKCVICGSTKDIVTISSYKGGYLCKNCVGSDNIVTTKTIKLIRMFYYVDISKITKIEISDNIKQEINKFIDDYYERYSGLYLKSKTFLKELMKVG